MDEMWVFQTGDDAGHIWQLLDRFGKADLAGLRKISKLNERRFYLALGWLARENNVRFFREGLRTMVALRRPSDLSAP